MWWRNDCCLPIAVPASSPTTSSGYWTVVVVVVVVIAIDIAIASAIAIAIDVSVSVSVVIVVVQSCVIPRARHPCCC